MEKIEVNSQVETTEDLFLALSSGIDIPKGTKGTVKEIGQGGPEGYWLHVHWNTNCGKRPRNCNPSEVKII